MRHHAPHKLGVHTGNTLALLLPWVEGLFLSMRWTVSSERATITRSCTSLSARNCIVQHCLPSGDVQHSRTMRKASCPLSNMRCLPGQRQVHFTSITRCALARYPTCVACQDRAARAARSRGRLPPSACEFAPLSLVDVEDLGHGLSG
jgi:hypothetical protein